MNSKPTFEEMAYESTMQAYMTHDLDECCRLLAIAAFWRSCARVKIVSNPC